MLWRIMFRYDQGTLFRTYVDDDSATDTATWKGAENLARLQNARAAFIASFGGTLPVIEDGVQNGKNGKNYGLGTAAAKRKLGHTTVKASAFWSELHGAWSGTFDPSKQAD